MPDKDFKAIEEAEKRRQLLPLEHCVQLAKNLQGSIRAADPDDKVSYAMATAMLLAVSAARDARAARLGLSA